MTLLHDIYLFPLFCLLIPSCEQKRQLSATESPHSLGISSPPCGDTKRTHPPTPTNHLPLNYHLLLLTVPKNICKHSHRVNSHFKFHNSRISASKPARSEEQSKANHVRLHNSRPSQGARNPRKGTLHHHRQLSLLDGRLCRRASRRQQDSEAGGWKR